MHWLETSVDCYLGRLLYLRGKTAPARTCFEFVNSVLTNIIKDQPNKGKIPKKTIPSQSFSPKTVAKDPKRAKTRSGPKREAMEASHLAMAPLDLAAVATAAALHKLLAVDPASTRPPRPIICLVRLDPR